MARQLRAKTDAQDLDGIGCSLDLDWSCIQIQAYSIKVGGGGRHSLLMFDFKRKTTVEMAKAYSLPDRVAGWSYHLMTVQDELNYSPNSSPDMHRYACRTLVRQLAVLLYLPDQDFFQVVQRQENLEDVEGKQKQKQEEFPVFRLRACLESCLEIFSREAYLVFSEDRQVRSAKVAYWDKLKEVVLMVLKRISQGVSSQWKITLLNGWFLDTVKLLDICLIFGKNYRTHVITLVRNVLTRGEELEDFQTDFRRVVDLAFLRLKELSQQFQGFAGIDFAALQEGSHQFQNFRNAEATLTKSLIKTLFSTYDLTCNLEAIADLFPARCRVHLLVQALIFKRYIMIYNKLRYYDEHQWHFGARTQLFRSLIDHVARAIVCFLAASMGKIAMLIRSLPPDSPYRNDLKITYINFWYFCLLSPAVSYEHQHDETRLKLAKQYGKELAAAVSAIRQKELFHPQTLQHFKRKGPSFEAIITAKLLGKQVAGLDVHLKALKRMENWRLPSYHIATHKLDSQTNATTSNQVNKEDTTIGYTQISTITYQPSNWSHQYDDQPDEEPQESFVNEVECFELSHYMEQEPVQSEHSKMERTATDREQGEGPFELDYSSICAASDHFMASGLSDSISEDSMTSVSAMLISS